MGFPIYDQASLSFQFYAVAARQKGVRRFLKRYFKDYHEVLTAFIQRGIYRTMSSDPRKPSMSRSQSPPLALLWMVDPDAIQWEQTGEGPLLLLLDGLAVSG